MKTRPPIKLHAAVAAAAAAVALTLCTLGYAQEASQPATTESTTVEVLPAIRRRATVPVRQVVLYSSGVGYFEHFGSVTGDGSAELRFKETQINDVLKSLVLQDLDGGTVSAVTYPSLDPLGRTLGSFEIDLSADPSLAQLLGQLRGATVTLITEKAEKITGTVLGVEQKQIPTGKEGQTITMWSANIVTGTGIRQVPLDQVKDVQLDDAQLKEELTKALMAISASRGRDKKPVTVTFRGEGERRVRLGYVVETPVWKTSYRLILPRIGENGAAAAPAPAPDAAKPQAPAEGDKPAAPDAADEKAVPKQAALQGWAIVENQTDGDWTDVQLSLISGRPISFIQDLYQPLYIPRPVVQPELYASLSPQTYDGGMESAKKADEFAADKDRAQNQLAEEDLRTTRSRGLAKSGGRAPGAPPATLAARAAAPADAAMEQSANEPMDAAASVASAASASKLGELFQYTVGNVSLARQRSAMIPIVTDPVDVQRLSIYNPNVLAKHPLTGARIKNTTGKHLLQGPITVLADGAYAGDARIDNVPPGQERLISYGIDLEVAMLVGGDHQENTIVSGKIVKGILEISRKIQFTRTYTADSKSSVDKTLVVEHPRRPGWTLLKPAKADETTDALYRFAGALTAGKKVELTVQEQLITGEQLAILPADLGQLALYARTGEIPKPVRDALAQAIQMKSAMVDTERQLQQRQEQINAISQEQARLRENLKTVGQNGEYAARLLKKLNDQETTIEGLQKQSETLQKQLNEQRSALELYLAGLTVG